MFILVPPWKSVMSQHDAFPNGMPEDGLLTGFAEFNSDLCFYNIKKWNCSDLSLFWFPLFISVWGKFLAKRRVKFMLLSGQKLAITEGNNEKSCSEYRRSVY